MAAGKPQSYIRRLLSIRIPTNPFPVLAASDAILVESRKKLRIADAKIAKLKAQRVAAQTVARHIDDLTLQGLPTDKAWEELGKIYGCTFKPIPLSAAQRSQFTSLFNYLFDIK